MELPTSGLLPEKKIKTVLLNLGQQFSTDVPQEFLKHMTRDYLFRSTNRFSPRLSNKKMTTLNTTLFQCECPALNHKYIGHVIELHFIGPVT